MKLIITVDTEEDNWGRFGEAHYTTENIARVPVLQEMFDDFKVKPTYLVTYPVARDEKAASILRAISDADKCEIGAHCHPWNTPPSQEEKSAVNSMLCNLPSDSQYAKLKVLRETIRTAFGVESLSFRSGRFGYDTTVARNLHRLGYKIDTSVSPYMDWTRDHGPNFTECSPRPFRVSPGDAFQECANGDLVEVPTTIGFLQRDWVRRNRVCNALTGKPIDQVWFAGVWGRLRLLNKAWLSPELSDGRTMIKLAQAMMRNDCGVLNMIFHSPSLQAGLTPFTRTKGDEKRLFAHLREFLVFARDAGIESIRLSEIRNELWLQPSP